MGTKPTIKLHPPIIHGSDRRAAEYFLRHFMALQNPIVSLHLLSEIDLALQVAVLHRGFPIITIQESDGTDKRERITRFTVLDLTFVCVADASLGFSDILRLMSKCAEAMKDAEPSNLAPDLGKMVN